MKSPFQGRVTGLRINSSFQVLGNAVENHHNAMAWTQGPEARDETLKRMLQEPRRNLPVQSDKIGQWGIEGKRRPLGWVVFLRRGGARR